LLSERGCFIVFEGIEGSGKTTASNNLQKYLSGKGYNVTLTREPTKSRIGILIEEVLRKETLVADEAIPLLFAADRADHTKRSIIPLIKKGSIVISDRYLHSSLAYQKGGMEKPFKVKWLKDINLFAIRPNLIIFLDISPEEGLKRIGKSQRIFDDKFFEDLDVQKRIRDAYYDILKLNKPLVPGLFKGDVVPDSLLSKVKALTFVDGITIVSIDAGLPREAIDSIINEITIRFLKSQEIYRVKKKPKDGQALLT
jgi:dTMP kinase